MPDPSSLRDKVCIVGVGETAYSRRSHTPTVHLALQAILAAAEDAGLPPTAIDAVFPPYAAHGSASTEDIMVNLGLPDVSQCAVFYMGGASAVVSLKTAALALATGVASYAVSFRARNGASARRATQRAQIALPGSQFRRDFEVPFGWTSPLQWYAMAARRHMIEFGTTQEQLGAVAVAMRKHAQLNPRAQMHGRPMTLDDDLSSRVIAAPYRLLDCSLETDGGTAVIMTTADRARDLRKPPVFLGGIAEGHPESPDDMVNRRDFFASGIEKAAPKAFAMAGTELAAMDGAMIYDCFTLEAIHQLEALGSCKRGEGGAFVEGGRLELAASCRVNTHGGLLSEAHMSGLNHVVEATRQLRGECGERQIDGARQIVVTGWGDLGDGAVAVLRRN